MSQQFHQHRIAPRSSAFVRRRCAVTLLETVVSVALAATLMTLLAEMTVLVKRHAAVLHRRDLVLLQLENVLEEATMLPWDELNDQAVQRLQSWQSIHRRWPEAVVDVQFSVEEHPALAMRIALEFRHAPVRSARPVRLTGWVFQRSAEE